MEKIRSLIRNVAPVTTLILALASCKDDPAPPNSTCTRSQEKLADGRDCLGDDQCPCGTSCMAGRCAAPQCSEASECGAAQYCDNFGRCRDNGDNALLPALQPLNAPRLRAFPERLSAVLPSDPEQLVRVYAFGNDADTIRAIADPGLQVRCPGGSEFVQTCAFSASDGSANEIALRAIDPMNGPRALRARLKSGFQTRSISYRLTSPNIAPDTKPLPGQWAGTATMIEQGFGQTGQPLATPLSLSIEADATAIQASDGAAIHLVLKDPLGWFAPGGTWHGTLPVEGDLDVVRGPLQMQRVGFVQSTQNAFEVQLVADPSSVEAFANSIAFELVARYDGLVAPQNREPGAGPPWSKWRVLLQRRSDTPPADTPLPPEPAAPDLTFVSEDFQDLLNLLGSIGPTAVERILCTPGAPADAQSAVDWFINGVDFATDPTQLGPISGDLLCAAPSQRSAALPLLYASDDPSGVAKAAGDLLPQCLSDVGTAIWELPADWAFAFPSEGCVDARRVVFAAGAVAMAVARPDNNNPEDIAVSGALMHRLVQQWLQVFTFIADEALQREALGAIARDGELAVATDDVVAQLTLGWDVLMYPHFATGLANLPNEVLLDPDYRHRALGLPNTAITFSAHNEQRIGLPANIAQTTASELAMAQRLILTAWRFRNNTVLQSTSAMAHRVMISHAMAAGLAARAAQAPWTERYRRAAVTAQLELSKLASAATGLTRGDDPLGVSGRTIPIVAPASSEAVGRFSSFTRWFLGDVAGQSRVREVIGQAQGRLDAAQSAYAGLQADIVRYEVDEAALASRVIEHKAEVGAQIRRLCGDRADLTDEMILDGWTDFSGGSCYLRLEELDLNNEDLVCRDLVSPGTEDNSRGSTSGQAGFEEQIWQNELTPEEIRFQFCLHQRSLRGYRYSLPSSIDAEIRACPYNSIQGPMPCSADASQACVKCADAPNAEWAITRDLLWLNQNGSYDEVSLDAQGNIDSPGAELRVLCKHETRHKSTRARSIEELTQIVNEENFNGWISNNAFTRSERGTDTPNYGRCLRPGDDDSIAASLLDALTASTEVEIARRGVDELLESYEVAVKDCVILEDAENAKKVALDEFQEEFEQLQLLRDIFHGASVAASGIADCASAVGGAGGSLTGAGAAGVECGARAVSVVADIGKQLAESGIERLGLEHDELIGRIQASADVERCYNGTDFHLIGIQAARLRVETALFQLQRGVLQVAARKLEAQRLWESGQAKVAQLQERTVRPIADQAWLDTDIVSYIDRMERARRYTYLAIIAAEYERQQSLGQLRQMALEADYPEDLELVVSDLEDAVNAPGIGGSLPSALTLVLRLRRDVLQFLDDRPSNVEGEQQLSDVERFRLLLQSPRFAVFEGNEYKGQRIPFSLAPLEAIGIGESSAIPLFTDSACGERLWSVDLSVVGSENLFRGEGNPSCSSAKCNLQLEKRNTFYSQWCSDRPSGQAFQTASYLPSANVFTLLNPGADYEAQGFSLARIDSALNVDFDEFGSASYDGAGSEELRGRGLYGDYAVFIPKEAISWTDSGTPTSGIVLNEVDDIYLRLEYTSVAK